LSDGKRLVITYTLENLSYESIYNRLSDVAGKTYALGHIQLTQQEDNMTRTTPRLPHQTDDIFLTDGGTETWLMYKRGFELPEFSAFHLLNDQRSAAALREYYTAFANVAVKLGTPFIFDSLR
jgi:hypothetical protein